MRSTARPLTSRQYSDDFDEISETAASVRTEGVESEIETIATESRSPSPFRYKKIGVKPCSHVTFAFAFASDVKNGSYGNK